MTAARPSTWMPMYWGDYLRDTSHLSTQEHGAYLLLIGHYWTTGKPLPDNDLQLARIARLSSAVWRRMRDTLAAFFTIANGFWNHRRIDDELQRAKEFIEKQIANGKKPKKTKVGGKPSLEPDDKPEYEPNGSTPPSSPPEVNTENPSQQPSLDAARAREVRRRVEEIINSPSLTMFNRVDAWLLAGADPDRDIYPTIEAGLKRLNGAPRSLSYFDGMISDAIAARTRPLPAGTGRASGFQKRTDKPGQYSAPPASTEEKDLARLRGYAECIKGRRNPGMSCTQVDLRKLLRLEMVTLDELYELGLAA